MTLDFEWDAQKAASNYKKHQITFEEAVAVFSDPLSVTISDPLHSEAEHRFIVLGISIKRRLLVVVHVDRGERIRIISARRATRGERKKYEEKK